MQRRLRVRQEGARAVMAFLIPGIHASAFSGEQPGIVGFSPICPEAQRRLSRAPAHFLKGGT
ncbi:MAG: hypothetical protein J5855_01365 [Mailhella sp.]|nr:hypothetical protein [Mailhella sp.]